MGYTNLSFQNIEFIKPSLLHVIYTNFFIPIGFSAPRLVYLKGQRYWGKRPALETMGKAIGFDNRDIIQSLVYHNGKLNLRRPLFMVCVFLISFSLLFLEAQLFQFASLIIGSGLFLWVLTFFMAVNAAYISFAIGFRLFEWFADKQFAESLCTAEVLYLMLDLSQDDILSNREKKFLLLSRINQLARVTVLLASLYASKSKANQEWVYKHFGEMISYIRERERWVIAPQETTLKTLRNDFYNLALVFFKGSYGEFSWRDQKTGDDLVFSWKELFSKKLLRFLGFMLPLIFMGVYLWNPTYFPYLHFNPDVVTLVFLSWFLLALDSGLQLGVVSGLIQLAKGLKDLR